MPKVSLRVLRPRLGLVALLLVLSLPASDVRGATASETASVSSVPVTRDDKREEAWSVEGVDERVLSLALGAAQCAVAKGVVPSLSTLTIIDYAKASTEPRLWVLDVPSRTLVYNELVAHGQGSGGNLATQFSNTPDSHQTSLGLFVTDDTYVGRNGYSLRLDGLEPGFNDRARERAIVMHGAPYVNEQISTALGRLGRSHGCPAVREPIARALLDRVKGGSLVFAYYPDARWLQTSQFLNGCASTTH